MLLQKTIKKWINSPAASLISSNPTIADLAGVDKAVDSSLKTQVEILKSPSVLMPIFEFIKEQKQANGFDVMKGLYRLDKNNVDVSLKDKTSVLNFIFRYW